jgi:hypothetical protein
MSGLLISQVLENKRERDFDVVLWSPGGALVAVSVRIRRRTANIEIGIHYTLQLSLEVRNKSVRRTLGWSRGPLGGIDHLITLEQEIGGEYAMYHFLVTSQL